MENSQILNSYSSILLDAQSWQEKLIINMVEKFDRGSIHLSFSDNKSWQFNGQKPGHQAQLFIKDRHKFFSAILKSGDIGLGESYVEGIWDSGDVVSVIAWALDNLANNPFASGGTQSPFVVNLMRPFNRLKHNWRKNNRAGSLKNIHEHYDLGNEFYSLWLGPTMNYSSALFSASNQSLESAQEDKMQRLCQLLDLRPGERVLEIGVGWAGLAIYMAKNYQVQVTGITISQAQFNFAQKRIKEEGLEHLISLELIDYRDFIPAAKFDKIVSIEMIEAVGDEYIPDYFKTINNCLLPNGLFVMQAITSPNSRYEQFKYGVDWIQKHIFPGSLLPSLQRLTEQASAQAKLDVMDLKDFGISYAKTLNTWRSRFWAKISEIDRLIPNPDFKRKWHFYLCYCEAAFSKRNISVVQILFSRPNNDTWSNESALKIEN